jgi:hypothetical protein
MKALWDELRILVGMWIVAFDFAVSGISAKPCKSSCPSEASGGSARSTKGIPEY